MPTSFVIAAADRRTDPILPSNNEALWAAVPVLLFIATIVAVVLVVRYCRRVRRSADAAASQAAAANREIAELRAELRGKSA